MPHRARLAHAFTLSFPILLLLGLAVLAPRPAVADPWQPLEFGRSWEYRGVGGAHQIETIAGMHVLRGRTVTAKHYSEGADAGLENYWQLGPDGTVLLCGFDNPTLALALAYEPPIAYLPGPPALGASRTTNVTAYNVADGSVFATFTLTFTVLEEVDLILPAGRFHALGTGQVQVAFRPFQSGGRTFALDGCALASTPPAVSSTPSDWYADGFGVVQYQTNDLYQLVSIAQPTPVAHSTWSAIKRLYQ